MGSGVSREAYFEAGLELLSELGGGGLKLPEVCPRLGVTDALDSGRFASAPDGD